MNTCKWIGTRHIGISIPTFCLHGGLVMHYYLIMSQPRAKMDCIQQSQTENMRMCQTWPTLKPTYILVNLITRLYDLYHVRVIG